MPRRNRSQQRRRRDRVPAPVPDELPSTPAAMAWDLVNRGLCSDAILDRADRRRHDAAA